MKKWSRLFISLLFQTWPELREGGEGTELEALADPGVEMPWTSCSCTKSSPSCTLSCTSSRWSPSSGGGRRWGRAPGRDRTCSRARSSSWAWARAGWCAGAWHHFVKGTPSLKRAIMMIDFVETQIIYFPSLNFPPHTSITKRIKWIGIFNMRSLFFLGRDFSKWNAAIFLEYFQTAADLLCNCEVLLWNGIGFTWCCSCRSVVTAFKLFYVVGAAFKHHPFNEVNGYSRAAPLWKALCLPYFPYSFWPSPLLCHTGTFLLNITLASALNLWKSRNWPQLFLPPPIRATEMVLAVDDVVSTVLGSVKKNAKYTPPSPLKALVSRHFSYRSAGEICRILVTIVVPL